MRNSTRGFSLIELLIVLAVIGYLAVMAESSFAKWIADAQVRTAAETMANDMRRAQAESIRLSRQVAFVLSSNDPQSASLSLASSGAKYWSAWSLPLLTTDETTPTLLFLYSIKNTNASVAGYVDASAASVLCFNSVGRLVSSSATISGATVTCTAPATKDYFAVTNSGGSRFSGGTASLRVQAFLGGQIRMCDNNKSLSSSNPDGC